MELKAVIARLERLGTKTHRAGLARFAIPAERAFGVPMNRIQALAREIGRDHALALGLWETGWLEARILCAYVDEPSRVTAAQMQRWSRDFDNWAVVDTLCFALWDRTPHAWPMVAKWARRKDEFGKRAAFAMLWTLALHDKAAPDSKFVQGLALIEAGAMDERNFVKKAANMALRAIGKRNAALHKAAVAVATRLAARGEAAPRWVGKHALLATPAVQGRLATR